MKIIDVSKHNGVIDWKKVRASGVEGVIIRAGFGKSIAQKDAMFEKNYAGAAEVGLHIGAYWYSYAVSTSEAEQEAAAFLEAIKGKKFDLPLWLDMEDKCQLNLGKSICTDIAEAFLTCLENAGFYAGIYSFDSFFRTNLEPKIRSRYAVWAARVENVPPEFALEWGIHQYSWRGKVSGIKVDVDMNTCRRDYPTIIRRAGLNGYAKDPKFTVTASISGINKDRAEQLAKVCSQMGMTVIKKEE